MTAHTLEALKGWPSQSAVDFSAKISANVTFDVPSGRCMSLNASGELETGIPAVSPAGKKIIMPIFLFPNSDDPDVANPGGIADGPGGFVAVSPTGKVMGLVGAGAYELETTEYLASDAANIVPNSAFQSVQANTTLATGGLLSLGTPYTNAIVGIASRAPRTNHHGVSVVSFWPYVLPKSS
jgi:hypothetical protein